MHSRRHALAAALLAALSVPALAADHRDSPLTTGDPAADINDVYTFTNPNNADELIVVATVSPVANTNTRFSDAVEYRIHLDNGAPNGTTTITCTFPDDATRVLCRGAGDTLYADGSLGRVVDADDLRVWAGLRDDPFFFDLDAFNRTKATLVPSFTNPGVNFFAGLNTLAIVLGIESDRVTNNGSNGTLKVYASTSRIGDSGVGAGISGMWYDPANPGHGLILQVLDGADPAPDQLVAYWNVFENGRQLNLYGLGPIDTAGSSDSASVPVSSAVGGLVPPAYRQSQVTQVPFGVLNFTFDSCTTGTMSVSPSRGGFNPVDIPLTRLSYVKDLPCTYFSSGQIDRMGRPGINTALIDLLASTGKKDAYNRLETPAQWAATFTSEIQTNLAALDTLDGTSGNAVLPAATLAPVLTDDRLIVNTAVATCDAYLAVELGVATQCGGRTLARDVIDDTLGAVVGPGVKDNVANDSTFLADFPFLGAPN